MKKSLGATKGTPVYEYIKMMKRFGWKKEDKIFYYTEFLDDGDRMEEDMITEEDQGKITELEKEIKQIKEISQKQKVDMLKETEKMAKELNDLIEGKFEKELKKYTSQFSPEEFKNIKKKQITTEKALKTLLKP